MLILASASPRRSELLATLGLSFAVMPGEADETPRDGEGAASLAQRLAMWKAAAVSLPAEAELVIEADTLVVLGGSVLGKPRHATEASEMLWSLRAREHQVMTGLALAEPASDRMLVQLATTGVQMRSYDRDEIAAYVATGDPLDKAGAYAIQHPEFAPVAAISHCYANVVGLPLCHLVRGLRRLGLAVPQHPLDVCPYAIDQRGCPWSEAILTEPADRWERFMAYAATRDEIRAAI